MSKPLRFAIPPPPTKVDTMLLGDVLHRLAICSPSDLMAIDIIARAALARHWPTVLRPASARLQPTALPARPLTPIA